MTYRGPVTEGVEILEPNAEVEQEGLDPRLNAARRPKMRRHKYICICADAVAAPDRRGQLVLLRAAFQHRQQRVDIRDQQVGGTGQLHRQRGV